MYAVRPEFGPTLPELLSGHSRAWRYALIGGYVLILAVVLFFLFRGDPGTTRVNIGGGAPFTLTYDEALARTPTTGDEVLRLRGTRGRVVTVRPLQLPAYDGRADGFLPVYAQSLVSSMGQEFENFEIRREGRTPVNRIPGYEIIFQYTRDGRTSYGRRILLLNSYDRQARTGVDMLLLEDRSDVVPNADQIGAGGSLKTLLRSFKFGH